jgi:hypothetical protein
MADLYMRVKSFTAIQANKLDLCTQHNTFPLVDDQEPRTGGKKRKDKQQNTGKMGMPKKKKSFKTAKMMMNHFPTSFCFSTTL